jgi:DNA polymerase-3 subunit delta'
MTKSTVMPNFQWPIVGHKNIVEFLQKSIANDRLAHAYLFYGAEHLGKTAMAENFVASILCDGGNAPRRIPTETGEPIIPCGKCINCEQLKKNIYPDVFFLEKEKDKKNISIEQTRELQGMLSKTSFLNSYKIAIIKGAEALSEEAADSLLKTLEDAKARTIIILISTDKDSLPLTVVSRCQTIKFSSVSQDDIFHCLVDQGATRQLADSLSHLVNGKIGLAIKYFEEQDLFKEYEEKIKMFFTLADGSVAEKFKTIEKLVAGKKGLAETVEPLFDYLEIWSSVLRDLILIKHDMAAFGSNIFAKDKLEKLAPKFDDFKIIKLIKEIKETKKFLKLNVSPRLAMENLVMEF